VVRAVAGGTALGVDAMSSSTAEGCIVALPTVLGGQSPVANAALIHGAVAGVAVAGAGSGVTGSPGVQLLPVHRSLGQVDCQWRLVNIFAFFLFLHTVLITMSSCRNHFSDENNLHK